VRQKDSVTVANCWWLCTWDYL